uniref:Nuclear receptor domain-containing protein n=1 Tax=Panagrellus redivivus TaxID=6233 RepID=A0A7E4V2L3_PANRE
MNTPDDPVIHSPPSIRLNQQGGNNAAFNQIGLMQCPPNGLMMSGGMPGSNSSTDSLMQQGPGSQDDGSNRPRRTKTCRVCGDHATGYNFNVITCESCKAFFRRNALRPKLQTDFKCPYSDDCEINAVSRRFCQKCRLKKCFDVGMKKEWILNEEQLRRRKNSRLNSKGGSMRSPGGMSNPSSVGSSSGGTAPYSPTHSLQQQQQAISRNSAIVETVTNNIRNEIGGLGRLNAFGMRSSTDIMSPPSVGSSTTTMSQQMLSPMNSMTSMSTSMSNTNTVSPVTPNVTMQREPISLNDIVAAFLRQQNPHFVLLPPPTASQTVKIVAYSNRLLPPAIQQQLRCGERIRIDFPIPDYALLVSACNISSFTELPGTGDLLLPDEAYEQMSNTIKEHVQRAVHRSVQQQQQQQREEQQRQAQVQAAAQAQAAAAAAAAAAQAVVASRSNNCYGNGYDETVRTTSMLPNTPQYDDISNFKMGPPPQVHPDSMSPESRNRYFFIENAITTYLNAPVEEVQPENELTPLNEPSPVDPEQDGELKLNNAELRELDDVKQAFLCMDEPLTDSHAASYLMKTEHAPGDIINIMDVTIRRIVKTAKRLGHFQEISNDGKLQLLKSSMIDMLTIRGVVLLDEQMKNWNTPILGGETKVSMDMFDKLTNPEQRQRFLAFCTAIHPSMRKNPMAIMLTALVVLFDNSRAAVLGEQDQEIVRRYHEMYYHLLQRYLESVYKDGAVEMIKTIPRALRQLAKINETSINLFAGRVDNKTVAPLPTEFFKTEPQSQQRYNNDSLAAYGGQNSQSSDNSDAKSPEPEQ